jgi:hypothetical protein
MPAAGCANGFFYDNVGLSDAIAFLITPVLPIFPSQEKLE